MLLGMPCNIKNIQQCFVREPGSAGDFFQISNPRYDYGQLYLGRILFIFCSLLNSEIGRLSRRKFAWLKRTGLPKTVGLSEGHIETRPTFLKTRFY